MSPIPSNKGFDENRILLSFKDSDSACDFMLQIMEWQHPLVSVLCDLRNQALSVEIQSTETELLKDFKCKLLKRYHG